MKNIKHIVSPAQNLAPPALFAFSQLGLAIKIIDLSVTWDTDSEGFGQSNTDAYLYKYVLNVSGSSFTVTDSYSGSVVF